MNRNFELRIDLGSDAMQTPEDLANALRKLADRMSGCVWGDDGTEPVRDVNGNTVGAWGVSADDSD